MKLHKILWSVSLALAVTGCANVSHKPKSGVPPDIQATRFIAIFFDGTANDEGSDTNVKKLHSLVTLQDRPDIASLYLQGVGIDSDFTGAATGSGINKRVQIAYEFILNHYRVKDAQARSPDKIYIFGFSRGAYSARILASMLYNAGLPASLDRSKCRLTPAEFSEVVHEAVAPQSAHTDPIDEAWRRTRTQKKLAKFNAGTGPHRSAHGCFDKPHADVEIEVLGLWDTVEALGFPNWPSRIAHNLGIAQHYEDIDMPNNRYGDKLCNVRHAFQAASIDDNRAWIFTPLLLTRRHMFDYCATDTGGNIRSSMLEDNKIIPNRLQEVWFAGAHSDVGGGYGDSALSGVSLNWMIDLLNKVAGTPQQGILPPGARVQEDVHGSSHNPSTGFFNLTYHGIHRDLYRYMAKDPDTGDKSTTPPTPSPVDIFKDRLCVHPSVFERRQRVPLQPFENPQLKLKNIGPALLNNERISSTGPWVRYIEGANATPEPPRQLVIDRWPDCTNISRPEKETP